MTALRLPICQLCHMRIHPAITTADVHKTHTYDGNFLRGEKKLPHLLSLVLTKQKPFLLHALVLGARSLSSPHPLTSVWLKSPADSGDGGLQRRHLESRGRRRSGSWSQCQSPAPKTTAILGHWPTNKRLSQIPLAPCLSALCVSSLSWGSFSRCLHWTRGLCLTSAQSTLRRGSLACSCSHGDSSEA